VLIETSPEFKQAIYAPERRTAARVVFSLADPEAVDGATTTLPPGAPISRPEQVINGRWDTSRKYATYEPDYWLLDGSFVIPPDTGELPLDELGWWSDELCDDQGEFAAPLTITVNLASSVDAPGLSIAFDRATGEHAADFDLVINGTATHQIRGNTRALFALWEELGGITEVQLIIHRWATGQRRARVSEILIGPVEEFGPEEITELTYLAEIDPTGATAPAGELTFTVDNSDKRFNLLNPTGLSTYLRERQRITSQIGVEVSGAFEWVDMGVHYLREWQSDEGALTASFTARDRLDLLDQGSYSATYATATTLHDVALDVLQYAGVPSVSYELPAFLAGITTTGQLKDVSPRQALLFVAQAAQSILLVDRSDKLHFVRLPIEPEAVDTITYDRAFIKPRIEQETPLGSVLVDIYDSSGQAVDTHEADTGQAGETRHVRNPLITSQAVAQDVAQWVITASSYRHLYTADWRQNPALEPGDAVTIQDDYGQNLTSLVTQQDLEFDGALRGTTRTRGSW
jgi:hypothetical protein